MNEYSGYNGGYGGGTMGQGAPGGDDMMMMGHENIAGGGIVGGQSLDDIVYQNANAIRRQSIPQQYVAASGNMDRDSRSMSMMGYNNVSSAGPMGSYQFEQGASHMQDMQNHSRRQSYDNLAVNTNFSTTSPHYSTMMNANSAYQSPAHPQSGIEMTMNSPYIDSDINMQMDYNVQQNYGNAAPGDVAHMSLYNGRQFSLPNTNARLHADGSDSPPHNTPGHPQSSRGVHGVNTQYSEMSNSSGGMPRHPLRSQSLHIPNTTGPSHGHGASSTPKPASAHPAAPSSTSFPAQPQHPAAGSREDLGIGNSSDVFDGINGPVPIPHPSPNPNNQGFKWETHDNGWPSTMAGRSHMQTSYKDAYSSTGFDMLGVLTRVATRPNPEISIGSVDMSCSFVVCDAEKDDLPIVYCSDNFERLTGYTKHMILGRNCRFLQSPAGNVEPGMKRKYVDDDSVLYLKNMVTLRREAQMSLINYRRGGQPFMNLLTMIPITWDTDQVKFYVGFQVDLVEQPNAVTNKNPDGSYQINYQRGMTMPRYIVHAPEISQKTDLGQSVPRDDVSAILSTYGNGESEYAKRVWDKVLLENTDDVIHVLSLKGLFQWVSPSAARILEYEASEIIGTALSAICHPSDIVPVTRELKDTSTGVTVNIVFRIRRKHSGYMWFEGHGSLHTEQGKGRKSIILTGRERPVYTLGKTDIASAGGIGENELWSKMSTSGMFLFVSSNVRQLLDRQPDELVMVSIQSMMRAESKAEFGRILEHARSGKKASVKHEMIHRRGQVLSAYTTLYPGDAVEGQKPTFIIAQTRLVKVSRNTATATRPHICPKNERPSDETVVTAVSTQLPSEQGQASHPPTPGGGRHQYKTTDGSAATYSGHDGLMIGHQDESLASEDNLFDELKTTKSSSWQYEIRQLEKKNRMLAEEVQSLIAAKKKRKRRKGKDQQKDCANCHTRVTPEWRRGPSGQRDLCNSCGLRWAKLNGRVSPRAGSLQSARSVGASDKASSRASPSPRLPVDPAAIKVEDQGQPQSSLPTNVAGAEPRESPRATRPPEGHGANMQGAAGVPDRIDEGIEESD